MVNNIIFTFELPVTFISKMDQSKLYNKFVREIEKLIELKSDHLMNDDDDFLVTLNMDDDVNRKAIVNEIVQSIQSKDEKNLYVKYQHSFRFYNVMDQYKKKYDQEGNRNVTQRLMNDIDLNHSYQVIKKTIRVHHFFNCSRLCGIKDAYKSCQISTREFYLLSDTEWASFSKTYEFQEQYDTDYLYWKVKKRVIGKKESEEESDKTISDLGE